MSRHMRLFAQCYADVTMVNVCLLDRPLTNIMIMQDLPNSIDSLQVVLVLLVQQMYGCAAGMENQE